ncbi:MAG: nickel pincer cofactor biosynthesis protein LarC [Lachnospiraceae bacterium]
MKKTLYLECYSGISGDMTVAALLDLGADRTALDAAVNSIKPLVSGFEVEVKRVQKSGIDACDFNVILDKAHENHDHDMGYLHGHSHEHEAEHEHGHCYDTDHHHAHEAEHGHGHCHDTDHHHAHEAQHHHDHSGAGHHHAHIGLNEITDVLNKAALTDGARALALKIFGILADAEAKAHRKPVNEVHFHEVGAVDSIVDIMSAAVCMDSLKTKHHITDVVVSALYEGYGSVRCQHGILPVPVPATANIIEAYELPVHFMEVQGEFVTPTGAAIAAAVKTAENLPPQFRVLAQGIGAGKRSYEKASILRAMIVEEPLLQQEVMYKLESNIDDCSGEAFGYVMDRLFEAGARDVYYTPIYMKKNRPSYQLNVICREEDISKLEQIIFYETTTIGIRRMKLERTVLKREKAMKNTSFGMLAVKMCGDRVYPEYESLAAICRESGTAYQEAYNIVYAELNQ